MGAAGGISKDSVTEMPLMQGLLRINWMAGSGEAC
jgi:hypothetical protein